MSHWSPLRCAISAVALLAAGLTALSARQGGPGNTPATSVGGQDGARVFAAECVSCHGEAGVGARAIALAGSTRVRAMSDQDIEVVIETGTSTGMPEFGSLLREEEIRSVSAYVRSLSPATLTGAIAGNISTGEAFFFGKGECSTCHLVYGRGSATGPDLSRVGRQLTIEQLREALADPGGAISRGYDLVSVRTADGRALRGYGRNEGNYTLPLQTLDGRILVVDKRGASITREPGSVMPTLTATPVEQQNLMAFLSTLRGEPRLGPIEGAGSSATAFDEILKPRPGDWPTYHGRLDANRHSPHAEISTRNVGQLQLQWTHSLRGFDNEMTPLVLDGIMYITATNQVSAIDAGTGREIWRYSRPRTSTARGDAARGFNRGAAVSGSRVFIITDNAHLLAISRTNGALLWEVVLPESDSPDYGGTSAPLVVGELVLAGVSGGDLGIRGFVAVYSVATGREAWRFWTIPSPGTAGAESWIGAVPLERRGGATWLPGSYDPVTDTVFWPTGNPWPDSDGAERAGDNLYTDSVVALDAKTGKLRWHFQFTPHDLWDWDAQEPLVLVDTTFRGAARKLLLQANRNGFFYVLDRRDGKFLFAAPFVEKLTWASGIGPDGRPVLTPGNVPTPEGVMTCPAIRGATNWMSTSFNPITRLFYVMSVENCGTYRSTAFGGGQRFGGAGAAPAAAPAAGRGRGAAAPPESAPAARGSAAAAAGPVTGGRGIGRGGASASGAAFAGAGGFNPGGPGGGGAMVLRALDIESGKVAWEIPQVGNSNNYIGTLSTAGGLVFYGRAGGEFAAVDAKSGAPLWHFETHETWKASPMTYTLNGRQYVAVVSGANVLAFALRNR